MTVLKILVNTLIKIMGGVFGMIGMIGDSLGKLFNKLVDYTEKLTQKSDEWFEEKIKENQTEKAPV